MPFNWHVLRLAVTSSFNLNIRPQREIGIFRVWISGRLGSRFRFTELVRPSLKLAAFRLSHVHGGACFTNEKVVTSARVVEKRALFFRALFTQVAFHEQPRRPHGQPASSCGVLVTKSAFTYARKNIHSDGPRNK
jgi:hypothetical protein